MRTMAFCLIAFAIAAVPSALAQSTFATITGSVTDPGGAMVPGAKVEGINSATNYRYTATANTEGYYTLANLQEGQYTIRAIAGGFQEFLIEGIELRARDNRRIDVQLQVQAVRTAVEVSAATAVLETEKAQISDVKDTRLLRQMPTNNTRVWDYLQFTPTVLRSLGAFDTIRFAGSLHNQGDFAMDGITMQDGSGNPHIQRTMDHIEEGMQEMRTDMAGNSAEYAGLGQLSVISRAGTNTLHGSFYDLYLSPGLQALDPFALTRATAVLHKFGASIGGPVLIPKIYNGRNKTFWFTAMEWKTAPLRNTTMSPTVPLAAWRQGDFSREAVALRDPFAGNTPFPGNKIPSSRLNPVALGLQSFWPLPNVGDPNVLAARNHQSVVKTSPGNLPIGSSRIDHRFSDKSFLFGRITYITWVAESPTVPAQIPTLPRSVQNTPSDTMAVAHTYALRPTLLNEFRFGFAYSLSQDTNALRGLDWVKKLGLTGLAPDLPDVGGLPNVAFTTLGLTNLNVPTSAEMGSRRLNSHFQDHVSWFRGGHSIKVGAQLSRYHNESLSEGLIYGNVSFSNRFTGHPYADFLLGIPTTAGRAYPALPDDLLRWSQGYFFTDEFKLSPKLTLTYGLRWDYAPPWQSLNGRLSLFDVGTGKIVVSDGSLGKVSPWMPTGYVGVIEASKAGYNSATLINADRNNFAPRFGVAWRPFGNDTVFRGGFGIFYDLAPRGIASSAVPFVIAEPAYTNPATNPNVILPRMYPAQVTGAGPSTVSIPAAVIPDLRIPYSMQYTATIEHRRWDTGFRLSYVGTNSRQGEWSYNYNQPLPDTSLFINKPRPFPQYPNISYVTNGVGHQYHSLTFNVNRRSVRKGLTFQAYYTLARDIGDYGSPENAYDRRRERGVVGDTPTHRLAGLWVYDLPFGHNRTLASNAGPILDHLIGGWRISGSCEYRRGVFYSASWTGPDPTGTRYTTSATPPVVTIRPNQLYNPNISNPTVDRWFDPGAFAAPSPGLFGTSAPGVIVGPSTKVLHVVLGKFLIDTERLKLRAELKAANVLNHANYWAPATNISVAAQVARISSIQNENTTQAAAGMRNVELNVRVEW